MIEAQVFTAKFDLLTKRFGKELHEKVFTEYYRMLSQHLTTEQFIEACDRAFFEDDYFPSPQKLVDKVKERPENKAREEWEKIMEAIRRGMNPDISDAGRRALRAIGGFSAVGQANTETQLPWLRKEFLQCYGESVNSLQIEASQERVVQLSSGMSGLGNLLEGVKNGRNTA